MRTWRLFNGRLDLKRPIPSLEAGRHGDAAAGGFRARQPDMGGLHLGQAASHVVRQWGDLLGLHVDMQRHVLRCCRDPTFLGVEQLLELVDALGIVVEQLECYPHRVARM